MAWPNSVRNAFAPSYDARLRRINLALVSRFRSSQTPAARTDANFGITRDTSNSMILVPLLNPKFATAFAAWHVRTSGSRHYRSPRRTGEPRHSRLTPIAPPTHHPFTKHRAELPQGRFPPPVSPHRRSLPAIRRPCARRHRTLPTV